jgi:O-antigen/teichoic acid export membrane protein
MLALFGPAFADHNWVLIVLVTGTSIYAAGGPASTVLLICGHESKYPFVLAGNIALRLAGFAILIPFFGLIGAAIAATVSLLVMAVVLNVICRRWTGIDPSVLCIIGQVRRWLAARQTAVAASQADVEGLRR